MPSLVLDCLLERNDHYYDEDDGSVVVARPFS